MRRKTFKKLVEDHGGATQFAKKADCSRDSVYAWMNRETNINSRCARNISAFTGVGIADIIQMTTPLKTS